MSSLVSKRVRKRISQTVSVLQESKRRDIISSRGPGTVMLQGSGVGRRGRGERARRRNQGDDDGDGDGQVDLTDQNEDQDQDGGGREEEGIGSARWSKSDRDEPDLDLEAEEGQARDGSQMKRRGKVSLVRRWMMTSERLSGPVGVVQWAGVQHAGGDWLIPEWPSIRTPSNTHQRSLSSRPSALVGEPAGTMCWLKRVAERMVGARLDVLGAGAHGNWCCADSGSPTKTRDGRQWTWTS